MFNDLLCFELRKHTHLQPLANRPPVNPQLANRPLSNRPWRTDSFGPVRIDRGQSDSDLPPCALGQPTTLDLQESGPPSERSGARFGLTRFEMNVVISKKSYIPRIELSFGASSWEKGPRAFAWSRFSARGPFRKSNVLTVQKMINNSSKNE